MRAVTWAFQAGRGQELATRLSRDAFQRGRELSIEAHILAAVSEVGLDRREAKEAIRDPEVKSRLREATESAHALGVFGVPTVDVAGKLFWGDDRLEDAAFETLEVRLARQLLYLASRHGHRTEGGLRLDGRFRQGDLADLLGTTTRSIITILNAWRSFGILTFDAAAGRVTIAREDRLQALLEGGATD